MDVQSGTRSKAALQIQAYTEAVRLKKQGFSSVTMVMDIENHWAYVYTQHPITGEHRLITIGRIERD